MGPIIIQPNLSYQGPIAISFEPVPEPGTLLWLLHLWRGLDFDGPGRDHRTAVEVDRLTPLAESRNGNRPAGAGVQLRPDGASWRLSTRLEGSSYYAWLACLKFRFVSSPLLMPT